MDYKNKLIIFKFYMQIMNVYELELYVDKDENGKEIFKINDLQRNNFGGIEQNEFDSLFDTTETLNPFHDDYIYGSLEDRLEKNEIIEKDDWDLTTKRFLASDIIANILKEITPTDFKYLTNSIRKNAKNEIIEILNIEDLFYKSICQKYVDSFSKEMLFEKDNKIFHIFIDDDYISLKEKGEITSDNYKNYLDGDYQVYEYDYYKEFFDGTVKDEIANDLNDLTLFDEENQWDFYITFEELKKIGYGFMIKDHYPLLEKYAIPEDKQFDFYNYFSLEQLDNFEETLGFYFVEGSIIYEELEGLVGTSISHFRAKENYSFNNDILRLACGLITYEDFIEDYTIKESEKYDLILPKIIEYFKENDLENLKDYGSDNDEGLYHFTDFYKDILDKLDIKYVHIGTEEKEPGEYTTNIDFDDNNTIAVDTKEGEEIDYLISNLAYISNEYDLWIEEKLKEKANNEIDLEVEI